MSDTTSESKEKILIVSDEVKIAADLKSRLQNLGYTVCGQATNGDKALELVEQHQPDLVMTDIVLQGEMDGISTSEVIRANWESAIIFLTSHEDSSRLLCAKPTYPFGYLLKPFQDQDLKIAIEMTLYLVNVNNEREKAEEELQLTLQATTDGIWSWNFKTNELQFSSNYYKMLGYEPGEFQATYENWVSLIHPDDLDSALAVATEYLETKPDSYKNEFRLKTKGGEFLWVSSRANVVERDIDSEAVRIIGHHQDIADRKQMELELKERESFQKSLMNAIPVPVFYKDKKGRYLGCNREFELFFGKYENEILGKSVFDTNPAKFANVYHSKDSEVIINGETQIYESQVQNNNGALRDVVFHKAPFFNDQNEIQGLIGAILDITERKQAEAALLASEELYRQVVERSNDGIAILQEGLVVFVNQRMAHMLGYFRPDEITGRGFLDFVHPSYALQVREHYEARMREEEPPPRYETAMVDRHGNLIYVEANAGLTQYKGSLANLVYLRDITEAKKTEENLRASEKQYRQLYESMRDGYAKVSLDGKLLEFNPSFKEMIGYASEEIPHLSYQELTPTKWHAIEDAIIQKEVIPNGYSQVYEKEYRRKDGTILPISLRTYLIQDDDGTPVGFWATVRDISRQKEIENELRESEGVLRALINANPESLFLIDRDGIILTANETVANRLGVKLDEIIGQNAFDLLPTSVAERRRMMMDKVLAGGKSVIFQDQRLGRYIENHIQPIFDTERRITKMAIFGLDVTERIQDQERQRINQARLEALYTLTQMDDVSEQEVTDFALDEAVRFTSSTGGYLHFLKDDQLNLELYSWSSDVREYCQANPHPHYPVAQAGVWADCVRRREPVIHNDYASLPEKRGLPSGHFPVHRHMSVPIFDSGKIVAVAGVGNKKDPYDENDVKQLYLFMDGMWKILRKKRTTHELIQARKLAEIASKAKSEFLANMSHEIRTPLTGLLGMLDILNDTCLTDEQQKYVKIAGTSSQSLLTVINDILDFSKIEAGKMEVVEDAFNLDELLDATQGMFQNLADQKGLNLYISRATDVPQRLIADSGRLRQILFNLVGNAVKFTKTGQIKVEASSSRIMEDKAWVEFAVSDTGVGIPQDQIENIFDSFTQVDSSSTRAYQGSGLGLSIVKRLLDLMGGRIEVQSEIGQGTTFRFSLELKIPLQKVDIETKEFGHHEFKPVKELRILLAEDNPVNRLLASKLFNKLGHEVVTAENGREALTRLADKGPFDLVFMDVQMPMMDGIEATKRVRSDTSGSFAPQIPIIAMTAHAMKGDRERFLEAGMDDYVSKPIDKDELASVIARVMKA